MADTTPMDASELRACAMCGKGLLHDGNPSFYEIEVRQCLADLGNIQRMHGLEQMMGGNVPLARVFSPENTVAHRIGDRVRRLVCMECALKPSLPVAVLASEEEHG